MEEFEIDRVNLCQDIMLNGRQIRLAKEIGFVSESKLGFLKTVETLGIIPMIRHVSNESMRENTRFGQYFTLVSDIRNGKIIPFYSSEYRKHIDESVDDLIDAILRYLKQNKICLE